MTLSLKILVSEVDRSIFICDLNKKVSDNTEG